MSTTVNREVCKIWIKALRSGIYKQGKNYLCKKNKYCCIGVLCEIAHENGVGKKTIDDEGIAYYDELSSHLPPSVAQYLGVLSTDNIVCGAYGSLINLNDVQNKTFEEIADIIEKHFILEEKDENQKLKVEGKKKNNKKVGKQA